MSLEEKLDKIRSPKLQNQKQTQVVLAAVGETLKDQKTEPSPTAYFAALLALLRQAVSTTAVNKELATSVVYLLDVVTPYAPQPLLRSKFSQILVNLAPALTFAEADAPLLRPSIGCLESLLIAQDSAAWELSYTEIGPRRAIAGLLNLAVDNRPKIRKKAQEAIANVLKNPPPSPALDHPASDMCAETALKSLTDLASTLNQAKKQKKAGTSENEPGLIHALQLIKTVAAASRGWPSKKIEALCEVLLTISKSSNEYMAMAAFEIFEIIFEGMAKETSSSKLPRLLEVISELRPSQNDSQLLPPWIAVISRGYDVSAQIDPEDTFSKLPELFNMISSFLASSSHNIRVSASECLISFMANCIPNSVLLEPSIYDEKVLEKLSKAAVELLSVKYQAAWMETFNVLGAMFDGLRWRADPILVDVVRTLGELRGNDSFTGKKEADEIIGKAIRAMGPESVLNILPLNLSTPKPGQPGRAWLLPVLREYVSNTNLAHFRSEFVPLSEMMFQRVIDNGDTEKTMEIKIFETLVQQIWALLPGYCDLPLDLTDSFDQKFAELTSNLLYKQVELRSDVCRALQALVDTNKSILAIETEEEDLVLQSRVSKAIAQKNIEHLGAFASNMLAVLFNVYSGTLPQYRGYILQCINSYLSIAPTQELMDTFERVTTMLQSSLAEAGVQTQAEKQKQKEQNAADKMPPMSHTLMDLVITIAIYLPRDSFSTLFNIASLIIIMDSDPQLQKKAYKLIPRLAESPMGQQALAERSSELQQLLLNSAEKVSAPARKDRLAAISTLIPFLPDDSLHFIPSILSEVVISCKEVNEKARTTAFDLLILMGEKIVSAPSATIDTSKVPNMPDDAPAVSANLVEYFTMVSAGLAGSASHMVSASITALTRILYHFRATLEADTLAELVETMDIFLTHKNREIVRSVLGFVKVCVISLSQELMLPRLQTLIPNLMVWSHEHKAHFKAKVKHILERMIRRFGAETVNKYCPEEDRKLIANIRKTRERNKRHKEAAKAEGAEGSDDEGETTNGKRKGHFESEYDEAVYGSDDESDGSDVSDNEVLGKKKTRAAKKTGNTYIHEDEDEPLDLLDRKALANISSTKPLKQRTPARTKAKVDLDGKLVFGGESDDDAMVLDTPGGEAEDEGGVGAYVKAIKGRDAVQRGRGGRLKFSNKRDQEGDEEMDVDEEDVKAIKKRTGGDFSRGRGDFRGRGRGGPRGGSGRGGIANGRRGLGEDKRHGQSGSGGRGSGRVMKSPRGRGRGRF